MKKDNPIVRLRSALGLNQSDFGRRIGRSMQSVRNYEAGRGDIPRDVVTTIQTLAAESGLADLALELSSDEWRLQHVLHPGEVLISTANSGAGKPYNPRNQALHDMLEEVLESGVKPAIDAVVPNLLLFSDYVRSRSPERITKQSSKPGKSKHLEVG